MRIFLGTIFALATMFVGMANAGIIGTYVDADASNTAAVAGGTWNNLPDSENDFDNLWGYRTSEPTVSENGGIWTGDSAEDPVQIMTTITNLTPGNFYDINVVFVGYTGRYWNVKAGLASDSLTSYYYGDGVSVETGATAQNGVQRQLQASLGTIAADASGEINVYVCRAELSAGDDRSWYDGVTYEAATVPEPSTLLLLICGTIVLVMVRWHG